MYEVPQVKHFQLKDFEKDIYLQLQTQQTTCLETEAEAAHPLRSFPTPMPHPAPLRHARLHFGPVEWQGRGKRECLSEILKSQ